MPSSPRPAGARESSSPAGRAEARRATPPADQFAELRDVLDDWVRSVPAIGDSLLERSSPRLFDNRAGWPEWIALRALEFRWRFQSRFAGEDTRFLFWDFGATARDMLDAELALRLRAAPLDDPTSAPSPAPEAVALSLPVFLMRRPSAEEFRRWAPTGGRPEDTVVIRLGGDEVVAVHARRDGNGDFEVDDVVARWTRRGQSVDLGPKKRWPLDLLLSVARTLSDGAPFQGPPAETFDSLPVRLEVWQLAGAAVRTAAAVQGWLDAADRRPLDQRLEPLRCRWRVAGGHLRAGMLVDRSGAPAGTEEADTFLAPFRVELRDAEPRPQLSVVVEPPDLAVDGDLRRQLLEHFAATSEIDDVVERWNEAAGSRLTRQDVERWLDAASDRAVVLRARRGEKTDAFLLILSGEVAGVPVAAVVSAEETRLAVENGRLTVEELDDVDLEFAGRASAVDLEWRGGARWLCELLSIVLRWRGLL